MADLDFENPTFDPDGPGIDDDYSFDLTDAIMDPPLRVHQDLNTSGDHIQSLWGELREAELEAKKKRLVDTFYKEVTQFYGLRPESIDYNQFRIDDRRQNALLDAWRQKRSRFVRRGEEVGSWRCQHWPRGTEWVVQMQCGDRWDLPVARGKVRVAPL